MHVGIQIEIQAKQYLIKLVNKKTTPENIESRLVGAGDEI